MCYRALVFGITCIPVLEGFSRLTRDLLRYKWQICHYMNALATVSIREVTVSIKELTCCRYYCNFEAVEEITAYPWMNTGLSKKVQQPLLDVWCTHSEVTN